jgi:actin-related protein
MSPNTRYLYLTFNPLTINLSVVTKCGVIFLLQNVAGDAASKIELTGGTTKFFNFHKRFETGMRQLVPDIYNMGVR